MDKGFAPLQLFMASAHVYDSCTCIWAHLFMKFET